jgi:hypothetical protein
MEENILQRKVLNCGSREKGKAGRWKHRWNGQKIL